MSNSRVTIPPVDATPATRRGRRPYRKQSEADPFGVVASPVLQAAARRVVAAWRDEMGDPVPLENVVSLVMLLATGVHNQQVGSEAQIDPRVNSALGRRLLDVLRTEVLRAWSDGGPSSSQVLETLTAIERVREAIEPNGAQRFADRVSGSDSLELLLGIAHDLRSPLTSILFLAETLQRGQSGGVNALQHRQLGLMYGAALGLSAMANDAIELAHGGDQLVEKQPLPFSVRAMLESVEDIIRPIAEEKQLAVRVSFPKADQRLGHPVALSRVLLNLTTNALKFTEEGHVEIMARERGRARVMFAVRDSGKGIDPAAARALYQPLRWVAGRGGYAFSRTGLGLTMCRRLVQAMGAQLKVETHRGRGTRFFFELDLPQYSAPRSTLMAPRRGRDGDPSAPAGPRDDDGGVPPG